METINDIKCVTTGSGDLLKYYSINIPSGQVKSGQLIRGPRTKKMRASWKPNRL